MFPVFNFTRRLSPYEICQLFYLQLKSTKYKDTPQYRLLQPFAWSPRKYLRNSFIVSSILSVLVTIAFVSDPPSVEPVTSLLELLGMLFLLPVLLLCYIVPLVVCYRAAKANYYQVRNRAAHLATTSVAQTLWVTVRWVMREAFYLTIFPFLACALPLGHDNGFLLVLGLTLLGPLSWAVIAGCICLPIQCVAILLARRDLFGKIELWWRCLSVALPLALTAYGSSWLANNYQLLQQSSADPQVIYALYFYFSLGLVTWVAVYLSKYCLQAPYHK